ncbi:MAG: hypothetical protein LBS96_06815 [Oscillospiraceae bacterium]|nr:hypothetical protein [Oscillospiraceae bacterium]
MPAALNGGILNSTRNQAGSLAVHIIGKIDLEKFSAVSPDIITDEVIITDERIGHIQERHPGAYERLAPHLGAVLADPDYILESKMPFTAEILKEMESVRGKVILRVHVPEDPEEFKNSVITGMMVDEKAWKRLIKNKKVLYKRE